MQQPSTVSNDPQRGPRAEQVAGWYFRLNGFLSIPGFVVHPDEVRNKPRTEIDLLAVRFPHSAEVLADVPMEDDPLVADRNRIVFLIAEVKASACAINPPWRNDHGTENIRCVIARLGLVPQDAIDAIARTVFSDRRWEDDHHVCQYVTVGNRESHQLQRTYHRLLQITWDQIAAFLYKRFTLFPMKLRDGLGVHRQWPDFGQRYGEWLGDRRQREQPVEPIRRYIETGSCLPAETAHL